MSQIRNLMIGVLVSIFLLHIAEAKVIVEPSATLFKGTINVPAGGYQGIPLQLGSGDRISVRFLVQGGLNNQATILFLDQADFLLYTLNRPFRAFPGTSGPVQGAAGFDYQVPWSGNFYIVFDNRRAFMASRSVSLLVYGKTNQGQQDAEKFRQSLETADAGFHSILDVPNFDITVKNCGYANAFSDPNVVLCRELIDLSLSQQMPGNVIWILMHEMGHSTLNLWGYPLHDNEEVADEFATVLLLMTKDGSSIALQAARFFANIPFNPQTVMDQLSKDDRHTLSQQRARNIISWVTKADTLLVRWQQILVPRMTEKGLQELDARPEAWVDHQLIKKEMEQRAYKANASLPPRNLDVGPVDWLPEPPQAIPETSQTITK